MTFEKTMIQVLKKELEKIERFNGIAIIEYRKNIEKTLKELEKKC